MPTSANELSNRLAALLEDGSSQDAAWEAALRTVLEHFHSETGTIHRLEREKQLLHLVTHIGLPPPMLEVVKVIPVGKGIAGQVVAQGRPVTICNLQTDASGVAKPGARQTGVGGALCVPLRDGDTIVGTIGIGTARPYEYTPQETLALEEIGRVLGGQMRARSGREPRRPAPAPSATPVPTADLRSLLEGAKKAWADRDFERSIDLLERASRLAPHDPHILMDLGQYHGFRFNYAAAEKYFEKAIELTRGDNVAFVTAGYYSIAFGRPDAGRRYFERALARNGDSLAALVRLARIEERYNRLDEAIGLVERALSLDRRCAPALLARARLHRLQGQLPEAEKLVRAFVTQPQPHVVFHAESWYELGLILDRQGRYDEAMTAFLNAKALLRPGAKEYLETLRKTQQSVRESEAFLTAETLGRWAEANQALTPPRRLALLCGHPRSGTTLLEQVLDAHPSIVSTEETFIMCGEAIASVTELRSMLEIARRLDSAAADRLQQARESYFRRTEALLGRSIGDRLLLDKNPSMTIYVPAVLRLFPEARFLVAIRDPRDVCLSCFMQFLPMNPVSSGFLSLDTTVEAYAGVMDFWLALKPRLPGGWLEVRYEELVDDLEAVARRTIEFLGLPWDPRVLDFQRLSQEKMLRSRTHAEVRKPVSKGAVGRWRHYQKYLEPHLEKLAPFVKAFGYE